MDKALKDKWIAALRGGEYKQGRDVLCKERAYCCLGVLYEVAGYEWGGEGYQGGLETKYGNDCYLDEMLGDLGISFAASRVLANMNDGAHESRRHSFAEIADYIEQSL